jgi:MFS family permease
VTQPRAGTFVAFRSRDFRLLWGGQTISFVGDAAFIVALGWRVTELTGKASTLGFVLALESLAMLATLLIGGVLADRYSRRLLMIGSDLARAAVMGVFFALDATGHVSLAIVLVLGVLFGLADGFFQPAFGGIVPLVVETPMLASANSWIGIARNGSAIIGPAIAATLYYSAGPSLVWAIDAGSFVVSAASLWLARPREVEQAGEQQSMLRDFTEGFRYVIGVPWIWTGIAAATVILMVAMAPYTALLPRVVQAHYHRGVGSYGVLFSAMAAGTVAGSLVWARWHPRRFRVMICFAAFGEQRHRHPRHRTLAVVRARRRGGGVARVLDRRRHLGLADADQRARARAAALARPLVRLLRLDGADAGRLQRGGRGRDHDRADDDPRSGRHPRRVAVVRAARLAQSPNGGIEFSAWHTGFFCCAS